LVLAAVRQNGEALQHAPESLQADREVVLEAFRQNGEALKYADEELLADREFVLEAVKENAEVFEYAAKELQKDKKLKKIVAGYAKAQKLASELDEETP
jgi:hypothetical protein